MSIFREYIGVKPSSKTLRDFPTEIINSNIKEFHFILGFANEEYDSSNKGTGVFKESWNVDYFGPEEVRILKEKYANVKVVISIGGRDSKTPFNPLKDDKEWSKDAVESLKVIIRKYTGPSGVTIDGIDINYQHINRSGSDPDSRRFANYLGRVITELRNDTALRINVVSIAPSQNNDTHYRNLYWANEDKINWVDYQFYNHTDLISTHVDFLDLYNKAANAYRPEKVLPGLSTDLADDKLPRENFIAGCIVLKQKSSLPGIFLWNANDSAIPPSGENKAFLLEHLLQSLLAQT